MYASIEVFFKNVNQLSMNAADCKRVSEREKLFR